MTWRKSLGYLRHVCQCGHEWWAVRLGKLERDRCWCGVEFPLTVEDGDA